MDESMDGFLERRKNNPKRTANRREKELSRRLNLRQTFNSGAGEEKGDYQTKEEVIDLKSTDKQSLSVTVTMWKKLERDAYRHGKIPVLLLDFKNYGIKLKVTLVE